MLRDKEDEDKLAKGVAEAVARGVLQEHPRVEPVFPIEAEGKSVRVIADEIRLKLGRAPENGCVVVIQGSSGTGKSTLVKKLKAGMPKAACWSNGNVFRALTLLALRMCPGDLKPEKLTHQFLETLISHLEFGKFKGDFDIQIKGLGQDLLVSEITNTLLKEPEVGSFVPMVAAKMQGEVVNFAATAACKMQAAGMNVLVEGRSQSLDYVRTPHRFELLMRDPIAIGYRRAAQRVAGAARVERMRDPKDVHAALTSALSRLSAPAETHSKRSKRHKGFAFFANLMTGFVSDRTSLRYLPRGRRGKLDKFVFWRGTGRFGVGGGAGRPDNSHVRIFCMWMLTRSQNGTGLCKPGSWS